MKDKNYRVFMILTFLAIIPFNLYHVYGSMILADEHVQNITVTLNLGQLAEMFFLVITTSILIKSGIKNTLIFGMIALVVGMLRSISVRRPVCNGSIISGLSYTG